MQASPAPPWPGAAAPVTAGSQWPGALAHIRSIAGGFVSVGPARPRLFPKPLPVAMIQAPVPTANSFEPLAEVALENHIIFEESPYLKTEHNLCLTSSARTSRPSKKRMGKEHNVQARRRRWLNTFLKTPEQKQQTLSVPLLPRPRAPQARRISLGQGYQHPGQAIPTPCIITYIKPLRLILAYLKPSTVFLLIILRILTLADQRQFHWQIHKYF